MRPFTITREFPYGTVELITSHQAKFQSECVIASSTTLEGTVHTWIARIVKTLSLVLRQSFTSSASFGNRIS
ncbi:hypothetical protein Tco_0584149 [Tanacetum coccineum]